MLKIFNIFTNIQNFKITRQQCDNPANSTSFYINKLMMLKNCACDRTAFPANPYLRSKSEERDVTLMSFTADLSAVGRHHFYNLCKIVNWCTRGYWKCGDRATNGLRDMAKKKREGAMNSPPPPKWGAG